MRKKLIVLAPLGILAFAAFVALGGLIVEWLWNWLVPSIFGWCQITFWQGIGLLALCRVLFGGFGRHGYRRSGDGSRIAGRWGRMSPEEKERFRQKMRERFGLGPSASEGREQAGPA